MSAVLARTHTSTRRLLEMKPTKPHISTLIQVHYFGFLDRLLIILSVALK